MSMHPEDMNDERLSAYADGEGSEQGRVQVQAWLQANAADAQRVRQWQQDAALLRDAVRSKGAALPMVIVMPQAQQPSAEPVRSSDAALGQNPAETARARPPQRLAAPSRLAMAATAAGVFALGGLSGALLNAQWSGGESTGAAPLLASARPGAQPWIQRAVAAHAVYVPEPRHPVEVKAHEEHLSRWLTNRIAAPVKLFDLREHGFELVGGRLLPDGKGKSAQLMYQDAQGTRLTIYLRKPEPGAAASEVHYSQQGDLGLTYWVQPQCSYAVVGPVQRIERERLVAMAQSIHKLGAASPPGAAPALPAGVAPSVRQ